MHDVGKLKANHCGQLADETRKPSSMLPVHAYFLTWRDPSTLRAAAILTLTFDKHIDYLAEFRRDFDAHVIVI